MNRQYLRPYGVQTIHQFQSEYTITTQIGLGGQATVYNVQSITPTTTNPTTSSSKCVKLFKIDMTDFKKSIKKFYQIINLYYIISSNNLSDYFHIYGNCDPSNSKWTGLIILMKKYHHTLSDTKYWLKTSQIQTDSNNNMNACAEGQTLLPQMDKITIENDLMNKGYMIGDNWRFIQKLCTDLLSHLDTMHSANIIHNDIKPDNIVFDIDDNKWKLIDFDLSMKVERDGREGVILHNKYRGSPYYSAPEVPINSNKNRQCVFSKAGDIWSLGMVISWCILKRNHIWFFINCVLENGKKKVNNKDKYAYYYFNDIIKCSDYDILSCIGKYGMNRNMNNSVYNLLGNMLINDFRKRKSVKYLKRIEIVENVKFVNLN